VGGNFSLYTTGGSTSYGSTTTDKTSTFNLSLSPKVGKFLSEKVAAGVALNINFYQEKIPGLTETITKTSTLGLSPFLRYYAVKLNKFSIFVQDKIGLSFSSSNTKVGSTSTDGPKTTAIYMTIVPGLAYDLSDKFSLETTLNFLSAGYNYTSVKSGSNKDKTTTFNLGAGLDNIVTVGSITVGAIYKF
jgi:hypothetical protein